MVLDALARCPGYGWVVLLQPTSPLRTAEDLDRALEKCVEVGAPACVSVSELKQNADCMYLQRNSRLEPLLEMRNKEVRQDLGRVCVLNGAVYVAEIGWLQKAHDFMSADTVAYLMPSDRSCDLDSEKDFEALESFFAKSYLSHTEKK